jgi:predicted permease
MTMGSRVIALLRAVRRRRRADHELDQELRAYIDELADRHVQQGMTASAARRAARLEVGSMDRIREDVRDLQPGNAIETSWRDARQAWRSLWRTPGFAAVAILTLGLGIGAASAIFTLVNALLLEPLPYREADRLVFVWSDLTAAGYPRAPLAGPEIQDLRQRSRLFSGFGGIWANTAALTGDQSPEQLRIGLVTSDFFTVLGADAALGRTFLASDESRDAPTSILLGFALWQRRYGADPSIVGRRVEVNGRPVTVIGVMPERFRLLLPPDASVPDDLQAWMLLNANYPRWPRVQQFLRVVGRMHPGVRLEAARQEVADISAQIGREFKEYGSTGATFFAVGLQDDGVREVRPALLALFAGVSLLLLIACVNVAGLLVTRAAARGRETALRLALGCGRGRLLRQFAIEGVVLAALGGAAAVVLARAVLALLLAARPATLSRLDAAQMDLRVLLFAAAVALAWGLLFSLAPMTEVFRTNLIDALQHGGRQSARRPYRTRAILVAAQIALVVVLLVSAGLLVRGFIRLQQVDAGFSADGVLSFRVALQGPAYRTPDAVNTFSTEFRARLGALPGVAGVGAISHLPYDQLPNWGGPYLREDVADPSSAPNADLRAATPGFFETVGARLIDGRFFTEADAAGSEPVAIVDTRLAERVWPGARAVGQRLKADPFTTGTASRWVTVVGVVRHVRHRQPTADLSEQIYFPASQAPRNPMAYVVRTSADPAALVPQVREALKALDPKLPMYDIRPLTDYVVAARAVRRFTAALAAAFAFAAILLACIGVYGVTAYGVVLRRQELGIRLALGAQARQIVGLVLTEGIRVAAWGLAAGLAGAAAVSRLLGSQLFGVTPNDPVSYLGALMLIGAAVALACWIPAKRATAVPPLESLRTE